MRIMLRVRREGALRGQRRIRQSQLPAVSQVGDFDVDSSRCGLRGSGEKCFL